LLLPSQNHDNNCQSRMSLPSNSQTIVVTSGLHCDCIITCTDIKDWQDYCSALSICTGVRWTRMTIVDDCPRMMSLHCPDTVVWETEKAISP